jgi:hypothetical protein
LATYMVLVTELTARVVGLNPTGILAMTLFEDPSMTEIEFTLGPVT